MKRQKIKIKIMFLMLIFNPVNLKILKILIQTIF